MYRLRNMIPPAILLTYIQWSYETTEPNEVMASWNLKYHNLKYYLRLYLDLLDDTPCLLNPLIQNQWVV